MLLCINPFHRYQVYIWKVYPRVEKVPLHSIRFIKDSLRTSYTPLTQENTTIRKSEVSDIYTNRWNKEKIKDVGAENRLSELETWHLQTEQKEKERWEVEGKLKVISLLSLTGLSFTSPNYTFISFSCWGSGGCLKREMKCFTIQSQSQALTYR